MIEAGELATAFWRALEEVADNDPFFYFSDSGRIDGELPGRLLWPRMAELLNQEGPK